MENKIVIANMKMYMNIDEIRDYLTKVENKITDNVILCPSNIYIPYFLEKNYKVGIQNVYFEDNGAYTGEISINQIKMMNINYVIIGHSERREYFHETDYDINKKLLKALENNLNVVLCVGENLKERNNLETNDVLKQQLEISLNNVSKQYQDNIIIAYEPRWAIGTGLVPSNVEINDTVMFIKNFIKNKYQIDVNVVYGGSVNESNIDVLNRIDSINGFMIGGACTNSDKMLKILSVINSSDNK